MTTNSQPEAQNVLASLANLRARISRSTGDIELAQKLRYEVFYREMGARASTANRKALRDADPVDERCDHLIVEDMNLPKGSQVIGTYRLMVPGSRETAYYSQAEFDVAALIARKPHLKFMELGRSCVLAPYRNRRTIELLWAAIWAHVRANRVDAMFGCASFEGTNPARHANALSCLYHYHRAEHEWAVDGYPGIATSMNLLPAGQVKLKTAIRAMPPLIKGYIRLGAMVGNHAFVDRQFGTTDVLIILPVSRLNPRYVSYYGEDASRHAAARREG